MDRYRTVSDEELMAACQGRRAGQAAQTPPGESPFDELVDRHWAELFAFASRFCGDAALAEDVVQETFLQVYQSADSFDSTQRFRPWLFTVAANKARDRLRRRARRSAVSLDADVEGDADSASRFVDLMAARVESPSQRMEDEELRQAVRDLVAQMPQPLREVLVLSYFHRFGYGEIARMIEAPLGTVKSRLHSAVGWFAERWQKIENRGGGGDV